MGGVCGWQFSHLSACVRVCGGVYQFNGCRSGVVDLDPEHCRLLGSDAIPNSTSELEGMWHLIAWAFTRGQHVDGDFRMIADNLYSIQAAQASQKKKVQLQYSARTCSSQGMAASRSAAKGPG